MRMERVGWGIGHAESCRPAQLRPFWNVVFAVFEAMAANYEALVSREAGLSAKWRMGTGL